MTEEWTTFSVWSCQCERHTYSVELVMYDPNPDPSPDDPTQCCYSGPVRLHISHRRKR